jgi:trk system potassium uptake protein TrkH
MLLVIGLAIALCWGVAWLYRDPVHARHGLALSSFIALGLGALLWAVTRGPVDLTRRDGFGIVTLGWIAASVVGALPFILTSVITSPVAAVFETMSGFTTTGSSVLTNLEVLPRGVLFWRSLTHFLGGMGVLVLCVAILPFLGVGGMQIYRAEMPGPVKDRLTPRITSTAKLLWGVYVLLVFVQTLLLRVGGMTWFDSLCHAFGTIATGGFSTRTDSIAAYNNPYFEIVIIVFMLLSGINFALHYRALRGDFKGYTKNPELRFFIGLWLGSCLFVTLITWGSVYDSVVDAARASFFQVTSLITTTGFATEDFDLWPAVTKLLLLFLMFSGACVGSTSGAIKELRVFVVMKKFLRELRLFMQPQAVVRVKLGEEPVDQDIVGNIAAFVIAYVGTFAVAFLAMCFFTEDMMTAASAVIATLGGVGPGMSGAGPTEVFAAIPAGGQLILTACMLLGRLELYTVLVMFLPGFWRK